MWRQGDVLIAVVDTIPAEAIQRPGGVLFEGEITGHAHRIEVPSSAELWECNGELYMKVVEKSATLVHDEHLPIPLASGCYRIWRQREYTPKAPRPVRD
jgi:hypothetical protein